MPRGYPVNDRWTESEDAEAVRLAGAGMTLSKIGELIGRSKSSVENRLRVHHPDLVRIRRTKYFSNATRADREDDLRILVYESALGRTRRQLAEELHDVSPVTVDRILDDLSRPFRTDGNWLPAVLRMRGNGIFVRERDRDLVRQKQQNRQYRARTTCGSAE
jgi:hypothetical protein